jgi:hypothetical protein
MLEEADIMDFWWWGGGGTSNRYIAKFLKFVVSCSVAQQLLGLSLRASSE